MITNDYLSLFPSASQERPRLMALAQVLLQQVSDLAAVVTALPASVSIASAVGQQLDQQAAAFGLSRADTIAGLTISDADYRTFLLAKLALWGWDGKNETVPDVLATALPGSTLMDNLDGTVTLTLTPAQSLPAPAAELFPVPAGVRSLVRNTLAASD